MVTTFALALVCCCILAATLLSLPPSSVLQVRNAIEAFVLNMRQAPSHPKHGDKVVKRAELTEALDEAEAWLYSGCEESVEAMAARLAALNTWTQNFSCSVIYNKPSWSNHASSSSSTNSVCAAAEEP
jgi:hypothetical protein